MSVLRLIIDAPGGGGKVPVNPDYVEKITDEEIIFRNYEGKTFRYPLKSTLLAATVDAPMSPTEIPTEHIVIH